MSAMQWPTVGRTGEFHGYEAGNTLSGALHDRQDRHAEGAGSRQLRGSVSLSGNGDTDDLNPFKRIHVLGLVKSIASPSKVQSVNKDRPISTRGGDVSSQRSPTATSRLLTDMIIENAVDLAIMSFRYPTARALRSLYDEKYEDEAFLSLVSRIFRQEADEQDLKTFARMISPRKKEGEKDNKAWNYFTPPMSPRLPLHGPEPAPYGELVRMDLSVLRHRDVA